LSNGDKLIIRNRGCEYFILTFRFETSRFKSDTTNLQYWFTKTGVMMNEVAEGINAPINIKKGLNFFDDYIEKNRKTEFKEVSLGEEIDFGGSEIRDYLTVDRISLLSEQRYVIEISFLTGPL